MLIRCGLAGSRGCSFCARAGGGFKVSDEVTIVLVLNYIDSRAEALEQDILWISASGAARCRRASAVQVREGVLSPRGRRGHAARDNGNPLCQGCEDQLPLSRSAARVLEPSLTGFFAAGWCTRRTCLAVPKKRIRGGVRVSVRFLYQQIVLGASSRNH